MQVSDAKAKEMAQSISKGMEYVFKHRVKRSKVVTKKLQWMITLKEAPSLLRNFLPSSFAALGLLSDVES